jgi:hypothetical protein
MSKLAEARKLVASCSTTEKMKNFGVDNIGTYADENARLMYYTGYSTVFLDKELSGKVLAKSLQYVLDIKLTRIKDEKKVKLGSSKYKGLPHLPKDFEWPEGHYFYAQINLSDMKDDAVIDYMPKSGMLYLFFDTNEASAYYYNGDIRTLEIREYPEDDALDEAEEYIGKASLITLEPQVVFQIDESGVLDVVPKELVAGVEKIMGCPVKEDSPTLCLFGRPQWCQGEDEDMSSDPYPGWVMLLQDEYSEGYIHFNINKKAAKKGDFSKIDTTYSGT